MPKQHSQPTPTSSGRMLTANNTAAKQGHARFIYIICVHHLYIRLQGSNEATALKQIFPEVVLEEKDVPGASCHCKTFM